MSKYLDKAIKEMRSYGDMGLPDGETAGGMGSQAPSNNKIVNAYKLNNILRRQQRAEEEEMDMEPEAEIAGDEQTMGMELDTDIDSEGMDDAEPSGTEEIKQFFQDNPEPSDEEVMQYADEHGIDMEDMRKEVYALIQSLLGTDEEDMGGEEDMGDEFDFGEDEPTDDDVPNEEDLQQGM